MRGWAGLRSTSSAFVAASGGSYFTPRCESARPRGRPDIPPTQPQLSLTPHSTHRNTLPIGRGCDSGTDSDCRWR
jgi:hypothetical protein